jgi:SAM-dependent methyltransferase
MTQPDVTADTGRALRALYTASGGVSEVFSTKVRDYLASRPDYPDALFDALAARGLVRDGAAIADVGAGTGLLTRGLLQRGCSVIAVEPSGEMRAAADQLLAPFPGYRSVEGTAERLPLPDASLDGITAAQAFHWFDVEAARAECLRVLRPAGQVALVWNDRVSSDPLHVALDAILNRYGGERRGALVAHESERAGVQRFFGTARPVQVSFTNEHALDGQGLVSLAFSRSYMPQRDTDAGREAERALRELFAAFAADDRIAVRYTTTAIIGRPG